jgi:hypothetical protein
MGMVTNGKQLVLDRMFGLSAVPAISAMGVGTDSTAYAVGQSQLNPSAAGSVYLQALDAGTARSGLVVTSTTTYGTGVANFAWNEIALFNGTVNGTSTILDRIAPIGPFTKSSAVSIVAVIQITQA